MLFFFSKSSLFTSSVVKKRITKQFMFLNRTFYLFHYFFVRFCWLQLKFFYIFSVIGMTGCYQLQQIKLKNNFILFYFYIEFCYLPKALQNSNNNKTIANSRGPEKVTGNILFLFFRQKNIYKIICLYFDFLLQGKKVKNITECELK